VVIPLSDSMTLTVMLKWFFKRRKKLASFAIIEAAVRLSVKYMSHWKPENLVSGTENRVQPLEEGPCLQSSILCLKNVTLQPSNRFDVCLTRVGEMRSVRDVSASQIRSGILRQVGKVAYKLLIGLRPSFVRVLKRLFKEVYQHRHLRRAASRNDVVFSGNLVNTGVLYRMNRACVGVSNAYAPRTT
jgi:hypothetical protein